MVLANKAWRQITIHHVVAEFLQAERPRVMQVFPYLMMIVDHPNVFDPQENHRRWRILHLIRCKLVGEIPPDTQWFEVRDLTDSELHELHVIARCGWDDPGDRNELIRVAARRPKTLNGDPRNWKRPILWGHDRSGPFTIIEGNNRLTAYASAASPPGLAIPALIGVSPTPCFFHFADLPERIANDLWK